MRVSSNKMFSIVKLLPKIPGTVTVCKNWIPLAMPITAAILCGHFNISRFRHSINYDNFQHWSRVLNSNQQKNLSYFLPIKWLLSVPFETYSVTRKIVMPALSWPLTMQCPRILTKCRCLSFDSVSVNWTKLWAEYFCFNFIHLIIIIDPSLCQPL